ncbi:MAG: tRNA epoxyqueuosine(34) reductase QueG [Nitrincola lacisaponensis]|uniref:Epoxyqueuosine reductase n=1 Tax=Nitrincola lacisaponensis TaxID=267850 RepID=A0A063Y4H4_9GAMM|nr:tRNA epoxyqueuosine(34) reductase QueG [Nitrincola lacisaponensis]KDE40564.1 Epoxyqueuosine (oQ) reductase QueG [Nitrincola lacisaponensis]
MPSEQSKQNSTPPSTEDLATLALKIKHWAKEFGFQQCAITGTDLSAEAEGLDQWLEQGMQGEMHWLAEHREKRLDASQLLPGTQRIISLRMDYLPPDVQTLHILNNPDKAYIARYTLGRDYHKLMRNRLKQLGLRINQELQQDSIFRPFVDSAPVLERPLARNAGLGWIGKHTLLLNRQAGSWFFLGELFINLPLPLDSPQQESHCGKCTACLDVCPTQAFPRPYVLDARRCISYLTIENKGSIPVSLRSAIGNRIFGCDDCQLVCPWNRFAKHSQEDDFKPRHQLDDIELLTLFRWDEATFLKRTEGSAIRRTGFIGWQRNLAVALGNSRGGSDVEQALEQRLQHADCPDMLREHIQWALQQLRGETGGDGSDAALQ